MSVSDAKSRTKTNSANLILIRIAQASVWTFTICAIKPINHMGQEKSRIYAYIERERENNNWPSKFPADVD